MSFHLMLIKLYILSGADLEITNGGLFIKK